MLQLAFGGVLGLCMEAKKPRDIPNLGTSSCHTSLLINPKVIFSFAILLPHKKVSTAESLPSPSPFGLLPRPLRHPAGKRAACGQPTFLRKEVLSFYSAFGRTQNSSQKVKSYKRNLDALKYGHTAESCSEQPASAGEEDAPGSLKIDSCGQRQQAG